jgi:crotonobetainyl-CoA:carnitine CoA-transferase CaiB-like acyl-CoA transferase
MSLLAGVRVLDLSNVLAGPFAGYQLALFGADVVKVERPDGGDLARQLGASPRLAAAGLGVSFLAQNSGKRSVTLNLKREAGRVAFAELLRGADVLLENFRPGTLARLGFDWPVLRELNPRLIYCAISGFGQTGPLRDLPAYDQIIQGLSGMMSVTGTADTAPLRVGFPVCDILGGLAAAWAIAAALYRRERTGQGCRLDVSMLDIALTALGWVASDHLIAGTTPAPMSNENATSAPSGTFETAAGKLNIAANRQEHYVLLCRLLGRPDLLADARFADRDSRKRHRDALRAELERTLRTRSAAHWERLLSAAGVPAARVVGVPEALASAHVRARELITELPLGAAGDGVIRVLGSGVRVDGAAVAPRTRPPLLGEQTRSVLAQAGFTDEEIAALGAEGAT